LLTKWNLQNAKFSAAIKHGISGLMHVVQGHGSCSWDTKPTKVHKKLKYYRNIRICIYAPAGGCGRWYK